ncbi:Protein of unknown function [Pyronema omphalodes CBS 100304]|uniref:Uncharacterized protein n=1 Tax=Pyronema omphalodes (strain CBS 100304) TaxID=1076935 RepID=U4KV20_PYROM|nr:Protein of unknown function [Pyronema omphalodes CBS 100304]
MLKYNISSGTFVGIIYRGECNNLP